MADQDIRKRITTAADQCVKCGLCLPHCPTYRELRDEADSPRGRIALIQGWTEGRIPHSPRLDWHLGNCLECRACETACPSLVRFGELMDDARALSVRQGPWPRRLLGRLWLGLLSGRTGARAAGVIGVAYRASGIARLARWSGLLRGGTLAAGHRLLVRLRVPAATPLGRRTAGAGEERVALFLGCIARSAQPGLSESAKLVLERLGLTVEVPDGQVCCGAMHRHNGFPEKADRLGAQNQTAFAGRRLAALASACLAELRTLPQLRGAEDICRLLADRPWPEHLRLRPLPVRVAVHEPCSQRNMLRDERAAYDLLRRIPQVELTPLPENDFCCGAAGTYLLQRPHLSGSLLRPKLAALAALRPAILVTTNTGCALHLAAGVEEAGLGIEVLHPVELVARQLP